MGEGEGGVAGKEIEVLKREREGESQRKIRKRKERE